MLPFTAFGPSASPDLDDARTRAEVKLRPAVRPVLTAFSLSGPSRLRLRN